jgi:hypothetical protein
MYRLAILVPFALTLFATSALADQERPSPASMSIPVVQPIAAVRHLEWSTPRIEVTSDERPKVLPVLYVSLAALQSYDVYSTTHGIARGAQEANSAMRGVVSNKAAFLAVKAGTTAVSILIAERMWKRNRVGAIVSMAVVNGIMASVAAHNASVLRAVR